MLLRSVAVPAYRRKISCLVRDTLLILRLNPARTA